MGFNFSLFGENEHRQFNYKPRFYDVEKEERRKFFGEHPEIEEVADEDVVDSQNKAARDAQTHKPGRYISGSFRDGHYQRTRKDTTRTQRLIGIISLVLIFLVFIYIAKFYTYLLS